MGDRLGIHDVVDIFLCYIWLILSLSMLNWSLGYYYLSGTWKIFTGTIHQRGKVGALLKPILISQLGTSRAPHIPEL